MEKKFLDFVAEILDVDVSEISLDSKYGECPNWDSLKHLQLIVEIGDEFGVNIPIDDSPKIKKLGDFYKYVEKTN